MKCDYYKFNVFQPYIFGGEIHERLVDAKRAFLSHITRGHRIGSCIYGCTVKDEDITLTYTPYYSDTKCFGMTRITLIGNTFNKQINNFNRKKNNETISNRN